jgi:hypothetical protein
MELLLEFRRWDRDPDPKGVSPHQLVFESFPAGLSDEVWFGASQRMDTGIPNIVSPGCSWRVRM